MQKRTAILNASNANFFELAIGGKQWKLGAVSDKSAKIDVRFFNAAGGTITEWPAVEKRATFSPPEGFAKVDFKSDKPVTVEFYITDGSGSFDVDVDLTGQTINVANTASAPLFVTNPPGQTLNVSIPQPNGCADALHVEICPSEPTEYRHRNERASASNTTTQWRSFDPTRQFWAIRNTHPAAVWLAIGGANLNDENATRVLQTGDTWYEDNPLIARQAIFIRTVPNAAGGGFPNGADCIFTYEERV
jgi:hypothetical protein